MVNQAKILIVDYDNNIPSSYMNTLSIRYRINVVRNNWDASKKAVGADLVIMSVSEKRRQCVKLIEHMKQTYPTPLNFILILEGGDDRVFRDRVNSLIFQCFKKYRFDINELTKSIENALEMSRLKTNQQRFIRDLDDMERELKQVEHRLFSINRFKEVFQRRSPRPN